MLYQQQLPLGAMGYHTYCKVLKVSTEIATPRFFFRSPRPVSSIPRRWGNLKNVSNFGESMIIDSAGDDDWRMLTCDIYLHLLGNLCIYLYNLGNEALNCTYVSQQFVYISILEMQSGFELYLYLTPFCNILYLQCICKPCPRELSA